LLFFSDELFSKAKKHSSGERIRQRDAMGLCTLHLIRIKAQGEVS